MIHTITSSTTSCDCGSNQTQSIAPCPSCGRRGVEVKLITPQHTLRKNIAVTLDSTQQYHFCENPGCKLVYYNTTDSHRFTIEDLKNSVTLKDDSPETPLCYCFKVLKQHALEEIARTGTTDVIRTIQDKMKPGQNCFCEKSNPRGDCCTKDIATWLQQQGIVAAPTKNSHAVCCS